MKSVVRLVLVLAMIVEVIVMLGHFGDLEMQSFGEWFALELIAVAVFIGTVVLFRYVGSHWDQLPVWQKGLVAVPVLASLWFVGPAIATVLLAVGAVVFALYSFDLLGSSSGGGASSGLGSWWGNERVRYDAGGRPTWVGDQKVERDSSGNPTWVGDQKVERDSSGNPTWVGEDRVVNGSDGKPKWVGDRKVRP